MGISYGASEMAAMPRNLVTASAVTHTQRSCLRISPLPDLRQDQLIDKPSFVVLPPLMTNGVVEVDILARLLPDAPDFARAFAGLACRIAPDLSSFDAVYLRPLNGLPLAPPPPRHLRAVQYFSYPDWDFQALRDAYPDGRYEAAADIAPDRWLSLRMEFHGSRFAAIVNGTPVLQVQARGAVQPGHLGLWVDIGTEAFFADLRITDIETSQ